MKQTYLEMIKMIENNQNYTRNFQKCHKLLKISFKNFAGKYDKFAGNFWHCRQSPCLDMPRSIIFQAFLEATSYDSSLNEIKDQNCPNSVISLFAQSQIQETKGCK